MVVRVVECVCAGCDARLMGAPLSPPLQAFPWQSSFPQPRGPRGAGEGSRPPPENAGKPSRPWLYVSVCASTLSLSISLSISLPPYLSLPLSLYLPLYLLLSLSLFPFILFFHLTLSLPPPGFCRSVHHCRLWEKGATEQGPWKALETSSPRICRSWGSSMNKFVFELTRCDFNYNFPTEL